MNLSFVIESFVLGITEGFLIFVGIFIITVKYLRSHEEYLPVEQFLENIDIYLPFTIPQNLKKEILESIDVELANIEGNKEKKQKEIDKSNKIIKKKFFTIFISYGLTILFILLVYGFYKFSINQKNEFINHNIVIFLSVISILGFEWLFINEIVLKYWNVNAGKFLKKINKKN